MCGPIVFLLLLPFICTFSEGKSCTGEIKILTTADNTADNTDSVRSCIKRGGKCCSVSKDGNHVIWDEGSDIKDMICDMCWTGISRMDNYELLGWFFEKMNLVIGIWNFADGMGKMSGGISSGMGKMWDKAKDWSGTKKQWKNIKAQTCIE